MKWKNSFKKGSLAAFVTLALTGSALAMPTGGTVENGSVNVDAANFGANDAIANVANGATITPQTNSIINWEAFNIAQGEALHFNTTNAALLNRVTGAQMSELLGQMTQVGGNFLYLINPNGIHIGGTASFDVSNLTLSTLNVASEDFLSYVTAAKPYLPSQQDAAKGAKAITVDQGAHFNAAGPLMLQASKVTVADGVTFVATPSPMPHAFYIRAAKSNSGSDNTTKTEAGNDVVFRGEAKNFDIISMLGSNITLDGAKLAGKNINMDAVGTFTMNPVVSENSYTMTAAPTNTLTVKNTQIAGDEVELRGGKVDVAKDVNFKFAAGANEANLDVAAVSNIVEKSDGNMQVSTTQGNDVVFHGTVTSDADRDAEVNIGGAAVNLDGAKFRMPKGNLSVVAIASSEDSYTEDAGVEKETALTKATAANVVQADGLDVEGNLHGTQIYGGKVDLKNTTVKTPGKIEIEAYTSREWTGKNNGQIVEKNLRAGTDNLVRLENTKLLSAAAEANGWIKWVQIYGGAVDIKDSELTSDHCVDVRALQSMDEVLLKDSPDSSHWYFPNYTTQKGEYHAGAENYLQISNSKLHANLASWNKYERPDCYVSAIGGKTSLKDVDMKSARDIDVYALREAHMIDEPSHKSEVKHDTSSTVTMHNTTMEAKGKSEIFGGKLHLKGSSLQAGKIDVRAGETNKTTGSTNSTTASTTASTTGTNNTLYLEDTKLQGKENSIMHREGAVYLLGGQVSLKKAEIHTVGENSRVLIYSGQMEHCDPSLWTEQFYMPKGMPLYMDSTKITTPFYHSHSGTAHLMNGTGIEGDQIVFSAAQMFDFRDMYDYKISLTKDNVVSLWDSKIKSRHSAMKFEAGGLQAWKGSEAESGWIDYLNGNIERTDGSTFTMQRDESSRISETAHPELSVTVATAPAMPTFPMFPLTPDNAPLSAQDEENIAAGKSEAQGIIASAADTEAQGKALAEAVGKLNNVPNASSRQKAGVVTGMIQAINEMNTLTTEEKHALQVAVLDAYGAVQEAKTEVSNRTQQANDDAMRLTTMESASANMPTAEEPQDAVHFAG